MELKQFMIEAKSRSYSSGVEGTKLPNGSKEFV
jgi:hypothetical protein